MDNKKLKNWIQRNKRILYWPLGGLIYIFLIIILYFLGLEFVVFLEIPFILLAALFSFIWNSIFIYFFDINEFITLIGTLLFLEVLLYLFGYLFNKIKRKELKSSLLAIIFKKKGREIFGVLTLLIILTLIFPYLRGFSYEATILDGKKEVSKLYDTDLQRDNFNNMTINKNRVIIHQIFEKPTPCTRVKYIVKKKNLVIDIIPKEKARFNLHSLCILVIGADFVEVDMTLTPGNYTINFRDFWRKNIFKMKTIQIAQTP